ncbi:Calx-beta domain-containing protein [Psychrobacter sp. WY6]|uniref:beta strand repeat-containing protein n=1 Tax=Psychrobacter sp. WY6 TaxID=2708350 RepID=UPI0024DEF1FB|nr:Calx-beta domain-containing protein [Psychrobacter sp. WY6]
MTHLENDETTTVTIGNDSGTGTIKDAGDAIPIVDIERPSPSHEGTGDSIVFTVSQTGLTDKDSTVTVKLDLPGGLGGAVAADILNQEIVFTDSNGAETIYTVAQAVAGIDITIPAGATSNPTFTITPTDDDIYEQSESLGMSITGAVNATVGTSSATGTILDEDATDGTPQEGDKPSVSITATKDTAIEGVDNTLEFSVTQSNQSDFDSTVDVKLNTTDSTINAADIASIVYTNAAGVEITLSTTAKIQDFLTNGASVKIPAGSTSAPVITITVVDDNVYEKSEDLVLDINNAVNATIGTDSATGTILDEDATDGTPQEGDKPTVSVGNATATEGDNLVHSVTINGVTQADVTYEFDLSGVTATDGDDYSSDPTDLVFSDGVTYDPVAGTITVPAGVTDFTVTYPTLNDTILENDETTTVTIDGVIGTGTILDNDIAPTLTVEDNSVIEATGANVSGSFNITDPQSVTALTVSGQDVTNATTTSVIITTSLGELVITGYNAVTGELTYEYTENGNVKDHDVPNREVFDQFAVELTNTIGDKINDTLDIEIIDTVPTANDDKNTISEETDIVSGNVLTSTGAATDDVADDLGADATTVTAVEFGSTTSTVDSTAPTLIQGNFGELTLDANGEYTYDVDNAAIQYLALGEFDRNL